MKPSKILKEKHRLLGGGIPFKGYVRAQIRRGDQWAIGWYQRKGYSKEWLNK